MHTCEFLEGNHVAEVSQEAEIKVELLGRDSFSASLKCRAGTLEYGQRPRSGGRGRGEEGKMTPGAQKENPLFLPRF